MAGIGSHGRNADVLWGLLVCGSCVHKYKCSSLWDLVDWWRCLLADCLWALQLYTVGTTLSGFNIGCTSCYRHAKPLHLSIFSCRHGMVSSSALRTAAVLTICLPPCDPHGPTTSAAAPLLDQEWTVACQTFKSGCLLLVDLATVDILTTPRWYACTSCEIVWHAVTWESTFLLCTVKLRGQLLDRQSFW